MRMAVALALLGALAATPATAQQPTTLGEIVRGTCEAPGERLAELTAPPIPVGEPQGAGTVRTAANSYTVVPLVFQSLLSESTAILVSLDGEPTVCSDLGGVTNAAGDLTLGLTPVGDADDFGVVYLGPNDANPSQTEVSLFVVPPRDLTEGGSRTAAVTPDTTDTQDACPAAAGSDAQTFSGSTATVTEPFTVESSILSVTGTHQGDHNFIVNAITAAGDTEYLFNELGPYTGQTSLQVAPGTSLVLDVQANGPWRICIESAF